MKVENVKNMYFYEPLGQAQGYLLFKKSDNFGAILVEAQWTEFHGGLLFSLLTIIFLQVLNCD